MFWYVARKIGSWPIYFKFICMDKIGHLRGWHGRSNADQQQYNISTITHKHKRTLALAHTDDSIVWFRERRLDLNTAVVPRINFKNEPKPDEIELKMQNQWTSFGLLTSPYFLFSRSFFLVVVIFNFVFCIFFLFFSLNLRRLFDDSAFILYI